MNPLLLNYWQIGFGYLLVYMTPYYSEIILLLLQIFQIRYYTILGEKERTRKVMKILEKETYISSYKYSNGKDIPSGYFIGNKCIGYIDNKQIYETEDRIFILTTLDYYKALVKQDAIEIIPSNIASNENELETIHEPNNELNNESTTKLIKETTEQSKITIFNRVGNYMNLYYKPSYLDISHIHPIGDQKIIVSNIVNIFQKKGRATIFLHGVSCAGKSSVGYLVAKAIKGCFCHTFNPSDPGDSFMNTIDEIHSRDNEVPIVLVLEEVNILIRKFHTKSIVLNPKIPTAVHDKTTWTTMLDDMIFYKNIVFILTSNESKEDLDTLDPAYLRKGRIDASYAMMNQLNLLDN